MFNKIVSLKSSEHKIWFTSDLHFYHRNILYFCNRPWDNVEDMNEALINNWNSVVGEKDIVYNLGDFAFATNGKWCELIHRLKGKHYLILGNHDLIRYPGDTVMSKFAGVYQQLMLKIDGTTVYLNHYPYLCYGGTWRAPGAAAIQLFGHVHSGPNCSKGKDDSRLQYLFPYQYDVGVDNNNYTPVSWDKVKEIINLQIKNSSNE